MFLAVQLLILGALVDQSLACFGGLDPSACGKRDVEVSSLKKQNLIQLRNRKIKLDSKN